jgi:CBS domain-containing protein
MQVRDIMTRDVATATLDTPVHAVARLMEQRRASGVPVVDPANRVIGIITESDLILRNTRLEPPAFFQILDGRIPLESPSHYKERLRHMLGTRAADVMTEKVVTIGPDALVEDLAALLIEKRVSPIPVVENGALVGIVGRFDIVRMMASDVEGENEPSTG